MYKRSIVVKSRTVARVAYLAALLILFLCLARLQWYPQLRRLPSLQGIYTGTPEDLRQSGDYETTTSVLNRRQDDPVLAAGIRDLLTPPSRLPYNLTKPNMKHFSQYGQTQYLVSKILHDMRGGFFVEAGAVDGEFLSNSLYLERELGWTGLLVEAFPGTYEQLLQKHRKAYSIQAALSLTNFSSEIFFQSEGPSGVRGHLSFNRTVGIKVKAFPLYSILKALNVAVIDFLSLDVEGVELKVLSTVPWDEVKVRVMCVEFNHLPEGLPALVSFMRARGYRYLGKKGIDAWFGWPTLLDQTMKA